MRAGALGVWLGEYPPVILVGVPIIPVATHIPPFASLFVGFDLFLHFKPNVLIDGGKRSLTSSAVRPKRSITILPRGRVVRSDHFCNPGYADPARKLFQGRDARAPSWGVTRNPAPASNMPLDEMPSFARSCATAVRSTPTVRSGVDRADGVRKLDRRRMLSSPLFRSGPPEGRRPSRPLRRRSSRSRTAAASGAALVHG